MCLVPAKRYWEFENLFMNITTGFFEDFAGAYS